MKSLIINITRFNCVGSYFLFHSFLIKISDIFIIDKASPPFTHTHRFLFPKFPNQIQTRLIRPFRRKLESSCTISILAIHGKSRAKEESIHKSLEFNSRVARRSTAAEAGRQQPQKRFLPVCGGCNVRISAMNLAGGPDETNGRNRCTDPDSMRLVNATLNHDRRHGQWARIGRKSGRPWREI